MRVKARLRGTVITIVSLLGFVGGFYGLDRNSHLAKVWLWVFFATGMAGGVIGMVETLRALLKARREDSPRQE